MNNIWIVDLEAVDSRYTGQWKHHVPDLMRKLAFGEYNVRVIEGMKDIKKSLFTNYNSAEIYKRSVLLELSNPHAIISQEFNLIEKGIDSEYFNSMLYEESFNSGKLAFSGANYYWVDPKGRVIKTEQNIHPILPKVIIEFYYK